MKFNPRKTIKNGQYIIQYVEPKVVRDELSTNIEINQPSDVYKMFSSLQDESKEKLLAIHLNTRNRVLCVEIVHIGGASESLVTPDAILRTSLLVNAKAIVVCHNHPSGDPSPSDEDIKITQNIIDACKLFNIRFLDHTIIGYNKYFSFAEHCLI